MSKINRQMRKTHSSKVKFQIILDVLKDKQSQTEVAKSYGVNGNLITRWRNQFLERGYLVFDAKRDASEREYQTKVQELENIIGKQTVEISLLKKFLGHYRSG